MEKRAIILAGGLGTRLKPYTISLPKPLVPIRNKPILDIVLKQLASNGFQHVTVAVNHQADIIQAYFKDGEKWGLKIDYSLESKPLGTMGPLKLIQDLPDNFIVMNGDLLTDLNFREFFEQHCNTQSLFTISSFQRKEKIDFGVLDVNDLGQLVGFREKPKMEFNCSMGIYAARKSILDYIPENEFFGFDQLMSKLLQYQKPIQVRLHNGYWLDIGRPEDYEKANDEFEKIFSVL
jgi:NDP-mannose synthase